MIRTVVSKSFVLLAVLACGVSVGGCLMSVEREVALGAEVAPQFEAQGGGRYPNDEAQAYVQEVGRNLVNQLSSEERRIYKFRFTLLNSDIVNAFALPGGPIFITRGLLTKMNSEDELAGVLGHEIGHVVHRHTAYRVQRAQGFNLLLAAVGIFVQASGGPGYAYDISGLALQLTDLKYGRDDESESDMSGAEYMHRAGYDPRGLKEVMRILKASGGGAAPEFFSTHPDPDNRLESIDELIAREWPEVITKPEQYRRDRFNRILTEADLIGGGKGYALHDEAEQQFKEAKAALEKGETAKAKNLLTLAEKNYRQAAADLKTHALPHLKLAELLHYQKRLPAALAELDRALQLEPKHHTVRVTRGAYRLDAGDPAGARKDLDLAIDQISTHATSHFYRGKALYQLKTFEPAVKDLQQFLESESTGPQADEARQMLSRMGA